MAIKLLIGGSPCTHWSIAQKNNRETKPEGLGWELFKNYLIAKEKFKPDFFLYENNKSAAQAIKDQIAEELKVGVDPDVRFTYINSALVSAQNRQRFYVTNFGDIEQPEDRCIAVRDILVSGGNLSGNEKSYALTTRCSGAIPEDTLKRKRHTMAAEPVRVPEYGVADKSRPINASYAHKGSGEGSLVSDAFPDNPNKQVFDYVAEPIRVGDLPNGKGEISGSQATRIYSTDGKSVNLVANGGGQGAKTGLYAIPVNTTNDDTKARTLMAGYYKYGTATLLTNVGFKGGTTAVSEPIGYASPVEWDENGVPLKAVSRADGKTYTVYEVKDGLIIIKGNQYPIKLPDGYYIIRKLTVAECARLQTMPDDYCKAVSDSQAYKALGNGWTAEVIIHLLNHALKDVPRDEEIIVLSLYDGIATGRYCLDKMGFTNVKYHAYEIDKYPITVAMDNYPDINQHGDAFAVREDDWKAPQTRSEWLDELLADCEVS